MVHSKWAHVPSQRALSGTFSSWTIPARFSQRAPCQAPKTSSSRKVNPISTVFSKIRVPICSSMTCLVFLRVQVLVFPNCPMSLLPAPMAPVEIEDPSRSWRSVSFLIGFEQFQVLSNKPKRFRTCCACTCKDYVCRHSQAKWHGMAILAQACLIRTLRSCEISRVGLTRVPGKNCENRRIENRRIENRSRHIEESRIEESRIKESRIEESRIEESKIESRIVDVRWSILRC